MKLIFETSTQGHGCDILPECDVQQAALPERFCRKTMPKLPELSEEEVSRHYSALCSRSHGVNSGFYPLGSCTMKYNPRINEEMAALDGFTGVHPLAPEHSVKGCEEVAAEIKKRLCEITGMDAMTLQPAAGAHGEFTGLLMIKQYHDSRKDTRRKKVIVPDSAHGTNPASAAMCGYEVISVSSDEKGCVDMKELRELLGEDVAAMMLTNPNTAGLFDENILEITKAVHDAGALAYYDGANLNAIMGVARPGDMGFDCVHVNLHKTFSTPHGGGGPGGGPVGCKSFLEEFLPGSMVKGDDGKYQVRSFYGNFLVCVKALTYLMSLGADGLLETSRNAVLNANYLMERIRGCFTPAFERTCMHEFVLCLDGYKKETGVSALDVAKTLIDFGMHPPTMYFPLTVKEALMLEPTETESKDSLDAAADVYRKVFEMGKEDPEYMKDAPHDAPIGRPDEVFASRRPVVRYIG